MAERIARGDIGLYRFAPPDKQRPVVSHPRFVGPSEVVQDEAGGVKTTCALNLHIAITVSQQRLGKRVARLSNIRMSKICTALRFSIGRDAG
jgi:hypothetical protein